MKRVLGLGAALLAALAIGACTGPQGPAGKDGKDGTNGAGGGASASVSAVTPDYAYLGRTVDLSIAGSGTAWSSSTTVTFADPKITVNKVTAASATGLLVNVTIAKDATVAATDVTVKDGSNSEVYKGAFEVRSPLQVTAEGSLAQGSVNSIHLRALDFTTPFDTTSTGDGLFTPITYTNIAITGPAGTNANVNNVTDYTLDYTMFVDVMTAPAKVDVDVASGPTGDVVHFPYPGAYAIAARTPTAVTAASAATSMLANLGDSLLFSYTPASASLKIVDFTIDSTDSNASPGAYFLPKSGKFSDLFAAASSNTQAVSNTDPFYLVAVDTNGYAGYPLAVHVVETAATGGAEKEPNETMAQATTNGAVSLPYVVQGATLSSDTDVDTYAITVTAADVGKQIYVQTTGLDPMVDTVVDIQDDTGNSLGGPSSDQGYLDDLTSNAVTTAGTYFVQISASTQGTFTTSHNKYDTVIRLQ